MRARRSPNASLSFSALSRVRSQSQRASSKFVDCGSSNMAEVSGRGGLGPASSASDLTTLTAEVHSFLSRSVDLVRSAPSVIERNPDLRGFAFLDLLAA